MWGGSAAEALWIQVPGAGADKPNSRKRHPGLYTSCSPVEIHRKQAIHLGNNALLGSRVFGGRHDKLVTLFLSLFQRIK